MYTATITLDTMLQSTGYIIAYDDSLDYVMLETLAYLYDCTSKGWDMLQTDIMQWQLSAYERAVTIEII